MQSVLNDFYTSSSSRTEQNCRICAGEEEETAEPTKMKSWSSQSELELTELEVRAGGHSQSWRSLSEHLGLTTEPSRSTDGPKS